VDSSETVPLIATPVLSLTLPLFTQFRPQSTHYPHRTAMSVCGTNSPFAAPQRLRPVTELLSPCQRARQHACSWPRSDSPRACEGGARRAGQSERGQQLWEGAAPTMARAS